MHMLRLISVIVAGGFVVLSGAGGVRAESQAGGLPVVADRVTRLEGVATTLQTAVTTLTTQVTTLRTTVTTLQTDNASLQNALAAEIAARQAADSALQAAHDALAGAVFQEVFARVNGDRALGNRIDDVAALIAATGKFFEVKTFGGLVNGARATVATLASLPPGNYLVIGRAEVQNLIHNVTLWLCSLNDPTGLIDDSAASTLSLELTGSPRASITLAGISRLTTSGPVTMECQAGEAGSDLPSIHLLAVQVGQPG